MTDAELIRAASEESMSARGRDYLQPVYMDLVTCAAIVGHLQLALRHPGNRGPASEIARRMVSGIIERVAEAGFPANAEIMRRGSDPAHDQEQSR